MNHTIATLIAVHGAWDEWSPWSLCSSTCGRGYRSRTRTCTPPQFGGDPCDGPEKQTKFCNIAVCPGKKHQKKKKSFYSTSQLNLRTDDSKSNSEKTENLNSFFCDSGSDSVSNFSRLLDSNFSLVDWTLNKFAVNFRANAVYINAAFSPH